MSGSAWLLLSWPSLTRLTRLTRAGLRLLLGLLSWLLWSHSLLLLSRLATRLRLLLLELRLLTRQAGVDVVGGWRQHGTARPRWREDGTGRPWSSSYPSVGVSLLQWQTHGAVLSIAMFPVSDYLP